MWLLDPVTLSAGTHQVGQLPAKFGGDRHSDSEDIVVLVCHAILHDHVFKRLCNFMGRSSFW